MDNFLNITENDLLINVPKKYYFNERNAKFIYSNLSNEEVTGLSNNLKGMIIEVKKEKLFNKKTMSYIRMDNQDIGWIELENSIRIYRLPNIQGKYKKQKNLVSDDINDILTDRIVKARYIYFQDSSPFLVINKVGTEEYRSISITDFYRANTPMKILEIKLEKGTELYRDSEFIHIEKILEQDANCKVVIYFENLNELRIQLKNEYYWVKKEHNIVVDVFEFSNINYELIDMIVYIKKMNKINKSIIQNKNNRLNNIESNITVSSDFEQLYLTKYLGDVDEYK